MADDDISQGVEGHTQAHDEATEEEIAQMYANFEKAGKIAA
jgi:hypothetical protein